MKLFNQINRQILHRRIVLIIFDIMAVCVSSIFPLWIRFDLKYTDIPEIYLSSAWNYMFVNVVVTLIVFFMFKLYHSLWEFAGTAEAENIVAACLLCTALTFIGLRILNYPIPRSYYFYYGLILLFITIAGRFSYRTLRNFRHKQQNKKNGIRVMIIGAGDAGNTVIKEITNSNYSTMTIKCIIDDNPKKWGRLIQGIKIVGGRDKIVEYAALYGIDEIIIAIPSANRATMKSIVEICNETSCKLRTLPGIYQLVNGEVNVSKLRDVDVEDLLGRDPIKVDIDSILNYVKDKTVMVTGGGGSIGSELCRQIAGHQPARLIIVDIYENNAYEIQQELIRNHPELDLVVLIASVRNTNRINSIMETYKPDIIYHAAAHKHVPLMEDSPNEAIKNNVFGTWKTAQAAVQNGVSKFVLISTDKAVNPTNIMGASKRICEMIIQTYNRNYDTEFVAVRFGNVLGSNGSVIPLFKKQIAAGGPVTVTHPDIIRYFMTIPEAVSLVLQAGVYAKGGEIFVLDMGEPVKILDLAKNLIKLSGYKVDEDIKIEFTGLRPGEKLYEELLMNEEGLKDTANKLIHIGKPIEFDEPKFYVQLHNLKKAVESECEDVRPLIQEIVPTYIPKKSK
ncbi:MAG: polysaccharide biosynthesis protein [Lachnospiraceae bacterium]|nr:polysaccharide biosynthesis protein [Lachnospiraceae bacterium]MBQ2406385.1 polysaccharide biosynthesis protein [Lachnospiraceae bacterium]MBQ5849999.1 polysaccharide biosynthesis protein [Lachnospiraceae bacterium]MEE0920523.1 nucleoside-diphosphate sugar epimerase/dehydratase [Lachnospiraceae bacterium]